MKNFRALFGISSSFAYGRPNLVCRTPNCRSVDCKSPTLQGTKRSEEVYQS